MNEFRALGPKVPGPASVAMTSHTPIWFEAQARGPAFGDPAESTLHH